MSAGMFAGVNGAVRALTESGGLQAVEGVTNNKGIVDFGFVPRIIIFSNKTEIKCGTIVINDTSYERKNMDLEGFPANLLSLSGTQFKFEYTNWRGSYENVPDLRVIAIK